ncbi:BQ2448_6874 [Microbotryum intermedium]|uniref:BQ2448_6874 protein n=1 Tax=Microbotryum intermedium TaxID=269621 RepID=A0A238FJI0_9BASI|nr:BQ2448_6874 [Microbotryum intermedium]
MEASPNPSIVLSSSTDNESSTRPSPAFSENTFTASTSTLTCAASIIAFPERPKTTAPMLRARLSPLLSSGDTLPVLKSTRSLNAVEKLKADRAEECGEDLLTPTVGNEETKEGKEPITESNVGGTGLATGETGAARTCSQSKEMPAAACSIEGSGFPKGQKGRGDGKGKGNAEAGENQEFDRFKLPTKDELRADENGRSVPFDSLIKARGKGVVCALNNLAQTSTSQFSTESIYTPPPLYILLISSGSPSLIAIYQQRLGCPFPLVVDKGRKLYKTLGMTLKTLSLGKDEEKGSYVTKSNLGNIIDSTQNGLAMRRYPGSQKQLGGEFVMVWNDETEEMECTYASRMNTTRSHSEVRDLFAAAGVHLSSIDDEVSTFGESQHERS